MRARNLSGNTAVSTDVNIHNNHHAGDSNNGLVEDEKLGNDLEGKSGEDNKNSDLNDIINLHTDFVKYEELLFEALHKISPTSKKMRSYVSNV